MQIILTEEEYNALKVKANDEHRLKTLIEDYRIRISRAFITQLEAESPDAWSAGGRGRLISREALTLCWNTVWKNTPVIDESRK
jgi:hypothetical protein